MEIFDKTVKYTGNYTKQVRLKLRMAEKKNRIEDIYTNIGEKIYREYVLGEEVTKDLVSECESIDKLSEEVEYCRMEILKLKDKIQCRECHREIHSEYKFCPVCGANLK